MLLRKYFVSLKNFDWLLFAAVVLLICFGLAALYSITISFEEPNFLNFNKQISFVIIGLIALFIVSFVDYRLWRDLSNFIYPIAVALLVAVLFFGTVVRGTKGWFSLMGLNLQPVELAKFALIIFLAVFLVKKTFAIKEFKNFFLTGLFTAIPCALVVLQPDLGSAIILFLIWFLLITLSGTKKKYLISVVVLVILMSIFAWFYVLADYQKDRILTFFDPNADPYGRGYHVRQATIAIGAGGLFGRGLGFGTQSQLKFIPDSQTDFIFAVIAEELGFVGVGLVIFFWAIIFYRLIKIASETNDDFASFVILGISILFFSQIFINIGMNIGLMPVTGISLPFSSYGGSFLLVSLVLIGIAESIAIRNRA